MQGGASQQFAQVPQNFLQPGQAADYIVSGDWGAKALKEAGFYGDAREAATSKGENYAEIPKSFTRTPGARYVHITTNNTIEGTEYFTLPETGDTPLVADMSSDYLALRRDYGRFALMYGGAQKNVGPAGVTLVVARKSFLATARPDLPKIYSYSTFLESRSLYNTPPVFAVYVVGLVLKWIEAEGGLEAVESRNRRKAAILYHALDELTPFYRPTVTDRADRSLMNVTWRLADEALEGDLLAAFKAAGMTNLKGHRSVGGFRASIYNAFPEAGVRALADLLRDFAGRKG
jgi:phosphoserine aminotransferase